jgi:hypothetical protein
MCAVARHRPNQSDHRPERWPPHQQRRAVAAELRLLFMLTALHRVPDIDEAVAEIARTWRSIHECANWSNSSAGAFFASA